MKAFSPLIKNSYRRLSLPTPVTVRHFAQNKGGPPPKGGNFQQPGKPNQQSKQQFQQHPPKQQQQQQQQQAPKQPQQPKQQPPVQQSKGNAVAQTTSTTPTVLSPEAVKKELVTLFSQEVEEIKKDDAKTELANQIKQYLDQSGFQIEENEEGSFVLTKSDKNYSIKVTFEESAKDNEEGYDEEEDFGNEDEEKELGEDADGDEESLEKGKVTVSAQIQFLDKALLPKGALIAEGFVAGDGRLYVESVIISDSAQQVEKNPEAVALLDLERPPVGPALDFHALPQTTQDKMYDFFDSVGLDDQMAGFIRAYTKEYIHVKNEIEFYEKFRKLLS